MTTDMTPPQARPLVGWMQAHPDRLRALLSEEASEAGDLSPVGDAAVRAHLLFVTEALTASADDDGRGRLRELDRRLRTHAAAGRLDDATELVGAATAHELRLQFGESAADDEALGDMAGRRVRIVAWHRVFLDELEDALGSAAFDAKEAKAWMSANQTVLADIIFAMDRRAKQREIDLGGPDAVASAEVANRIGQAATLHAHTRFLADALERHLPRSSTA